MAKKIAVLHVPHEQCEASMKEMLTSVGYTVYGIGRDVAHMVNPYMRPVVSSRIMPQATPKEFNECRIFVTVKHYNLPGIYENHPHLNGRVLWFDINGGVPGELVTKEPKKSYPFEVPVPYVSANKRYTDDSGYKVSGPRYVCYIPLTNRDMFLQAAHKRSMRDPPVCMVHNPAHWGYGWLVQPLRSKHNVVFFGGFGALDGQIPYTKVPLTLANSLCMIHAKGRDCPGCALYESLLTGCPVIITSLFLQRTQYTDLYVDNETCYIVNDDTSLDIPGRCELLMDQISARVKSLRDPVENRRIGSAGRQKITKLMWQSSRESDVQSFREFIDRNFP